MRLNARVFCVKERGPPWVIRAGYTRGSSWKSWWLCSC